MDGLRLPAHKRLLGTPEKKAMTTYSFQTDLLIYVSSANTETTKKKRNCETGSDEKLGSRIQHQKPNLPSLQYQQFEGVPKDR